MGTDIAGSVRGEASVWSRSPDVRRTNAATNYAPDALKETVANSPWKVVVTTVGQRWTEGERSRPPGPDNSSVASTAVVLWF
jgi:hypothetical protein